VVTSTIVFEGNGVILNTPADTTTGSISGKPRRRKKPKAERKRLQNPPQIRRKGKSFLSRKKGAGIPARAPGWKRKSGRRIALPLWRTLSLYKDSGDRVSGLRQSWSPWKANCIFFTSAGRSWSPAPGINPLCYCDFNNQSPVG
jgi:hypothetical protein